MARQRGRGQTALVADSPCSTEQHRHAHRQYACGGREVRTQAVTGTRRTTILIGNWRLILQTIETVCMRFGSLCAAARSLNSSPGRPEDRPVDQQDDQQKQTKQGMAAEAHGLFRVCHYLAFFKSDSPSLAAQEIGITLCSRLRSPEGIIVDTRTLTSLLGALALNTSLALAQTPPPGTPPPAMPHLHDKQTTMQDLMAKIHASKDAAERHELMQEHMKLMQEQMGKMKRGGKMNHESMQNRMDHMERMMEQMLQHQAAEHGSKATK